MTKARNQEKVGGVTHPVIMWCYMQEAEQCDLVKVQAMCTHINFVCFVYAMHER